MVLVFLTEICQLHPSADCQLSVLSPKRVFFCFIPNSSPISKSTLLLVQVLRLFLNLSLVFSWSACCYCLCSWCVLLAGWHLCHETNRGTTFSSWQANQTNIKELGGRGLGDISYQDINVGLGVEKELMVEMVTTALSMLKDLVGLRAGQTVIPPRVLMVKITEVGKLPPSVGCQLRVLSTPQRFLFTPSPSCYDLCPTAVTFCQCLLNRHLIDNYC